MEITYFIDWQDEYKQHSDRWLNHGRRVAESSCRHKTQNKDKDESETNMLYSGWCEECDLYEDSCEPMMNYGYLLYGLPDGEKVLNIIKETCLTVMENDETGQCFLVLCGGGMDLSQSIAYAYLLAGQRIPDELVFEVSAQPCLSVNKKAYFQVMRACKAELEGVRQRALGRIKQIDEVLGQENNTPAICEK